jgi:nucleoside-diphosphate-sugar epimerase
MRKILITGAVGQIGSDLTMYLREKHGNENVVAVGHRTKPSEKLLNSGAFEFIKIEDINEVENVIKKYDIGTIYHLAAILSAIGEKK